MSDHASGFSFEIIRDYLLNEGGKVEYHKLIKHFRHSLADPSNKGKQWRQEDGVCRRPQQHQLFRIMFHTSSFCHSIDSSFVLRFVRQTQITLIVFYLEFTLTFFRSFRGSRFVQGFGQQSGRRHKRTERKVFEPSIDLDHNSQSTFVRHFDHFRFVVRRLFARDQLARLAITVSRST
jgi:hypothetical protein